MHDWRRPAAALLATMLFAGALRAFVSGVYNGNLNALGLTWTAALPLLLVLPVALRGEARPWLRAGAVALAVGRVALPWVPAGNASIVVSGLATLGALVTLAALLPGADATVAGGIVAGFAADVALVAWGRSWDATLASPILVAPLAVLLVALAWPLRPAPAGSATRGRLVAVGLGAWLFLETAILANPFGLARWNEAPLAGTLLPAAIGLGLGALLGPRLTARMPLVALNAAALLFAFDHAILHSAMIPVGIVLAQLAMGADLVALAGPLASRPFAASARTMGLAALVMILLQFFAVFGFVFAYVPASALWKGDQAWVAPLAVVLVAAPALLAEPRAAPPPPMPRAGALVAALLVVLAAAPLALPAAAVPETQSPTLRVMTFNLHQGFDNAGALDPDVFVRIVADAKPDLVVAQEYDATRMSSGNLDLLRILGDRLGYHVVYGPPTSAEGFAGAVLSRVPVQETSWFALPTTKDNRYVTETRLTVAGRDVWLYGVHFGLGVSDRAAQIDALLARAAARSGPRLLVGDFNSCPTTCEDEDGGHVYGVLAASPFRDAWVASGHGANDTAGNTYASFDPTERIDQVWTSAEWDVRSVDVLRSGDVVAASDHAPVLATLNLSR